MKCEWKKLSDFANIIVGFPFKSASFNTKGKGVRLVRGKNVTHLTFRWGEDARWWNDFSTDLEKYYLREGDILIGMDGSLVGQNYVRVQADDLPLLLVQRVACIRAKDGADQDFLWSCISNRRFELYIDAIKTGTSIPHISGKQIGEYLIPDFSHSEQSKIGSILRALDDKIECNNRINKNLEEQARALFQSWFVDYDLIPKDQLCESEMGMIPKTWEIKTMQEVTSNLKNRVKDKHYKVFSAVNTGCLQLSEEYFNKQVFSKDIKNYLTVEPFDFAYNPARINIGSIGINSFGYTGCVSPIYVVIRAKTRYHYFFDFLFKSARFKSEVKKRASGSVRQSLTYDDFAQIRIVCPPIELVEAFNERYEQIVNVIAHLSEEVNTLVSIRDTLLPKLMSGELDVSELDI